MKKAYSITVKTRNPNTGFFVTPVIIGVIRKSVRMLYIRYVVIINLPVLFLTRKKYRQIATILDK